MKAASVQELKQSLKENSQAELVELCLRLARFKKENKELLTYLLFEADDEEAYIKNVKEELDEGFQGIKNLNPYFAKKSLRKILRIANKYIRYTGSKIAETEVLLHYTAAFKGLKLPLHKNKALDNIYKAQLKKTRAAIASLHEDLQYDYLRQLERLE
jgi:hypothetical protein